MVSAEKHFLEAGGCGQGLDNGIRVFQVSNSKLLVFAGGGPERGPRYVKLSCNGPEMMYIQSIFRVPHEPEKHQHESLLSGSS